MVVLTTHIDTLDRQWDGEDILKSERRLPKVVAPPGKFRGIAFLKHHKNLIKENEMFKDTFSGLVSLLGTPLPTRKFEKEMLTYAKTEYGKDWQYAYSYMLTHGGRGPRAGVFN